MYFVILSNAFRERTCKHDRRAKGNPMKALFGVTGISG